MEIYQTSLHRRADSCQAGKLEGPISKQQPEQKAVANHRREIQGQKTHLKHQVFRTDQKQNGDASFTYGCLDPTMLTQMAKYLDTVYISGWQCSSTASSTHEPSPDLADYPMVSHFPELNERKFLISKRIPSQNKFNDCSWHNFSTTENNARNVSQPPKQTEPMLQTPTSSDP